MALATLVSLLAISVATSAETPVVKSCPNTEGATGLTVDNGWYVHDGRVVWGFCQHNGWWREGQRPNLTRNAADEVGPNRTEHLDRLTDAMLRFGYPGFEHNFGLWYDRRRDAHDQARRDDGRVIPPFLEQPWARGDRLTAWDGMPKYDLTRFNDWYFERLKQFADLCDRKGTILFHNFYMQHALLETNAHYVDFPWRPVNCIQPTGLPDSTPAANAFYDVSHPLRRELHRAYIRKCLDVLGGNTNVVFLCSEEYTGPLSFMRFWIDTIIEWERETDRDVQIGLSATKDVLDAVLGDPERAPQIGTIDLRYWWYKPDGTLFAPAGGRQIPARFTGAFSPEHLASITAMTQHYTNRGMGEIGTTSTEQVYRQVREYREKYPTKAILHQVPASRRQAWAMLAAGASMLVGQLPYPEKKDPPAYVSPELCRSIQPTYDFIREHLLETLPRCKPSDVQKGNPAETWCLTDGRDTCLVYTSGGSCFQLDLSRTLGEFQVQWFDPGTGEIAGVKRIAAGSQPEFTPPSSSDWVFYMQRIDQ